MQQLPRLTLLLLIGALASACSRPAQPVAGLSDKIAVATPGMIPCRICAYDLSEMKLTGTLDDELVGSSRFPIQWLKAVYYFEEERLDTLTVSIGSGTDETPITQTTSFTDVDLVELRWMDSENVVDNPPPLADIVD
jgi:hypothetical protein